MKNTKRLYLVSFLALFVAGVAHADIASTKYVDDALPDVPVLKAAGSLSQPVYLSKDDVATPVNSIARGLLPSADGPNQQQGTVFVWDDEFLEEGNIDEEELVDWLDGNRAEIVPTLRHVETIVDGIGGSVSALERELDKTNIGLSHYKQDLINPKQYCYWDTEEGTGKPVLSCDDIGDEYARKEFVTIDSDGNVVPGQIAFSGAGEFLKDIDINDDGHVMIKRGNAPTYTLPVATDETLGGVKVPKNGPIQVSSTGDISVLEATVDMGDNDEPDFKTGVVKVWSKHIDDSCVGNSCSEYIDPDFDNNHADDVVPTVAFVQAQLDTMVQEQVDGKVSAGIDADEWDMLYSSDADSNTGDFPATLYFEDGKPVVGVAERLKASVLPLPGEDSDGHPSKGAVYVANSTDELEAIIADVGEENLRAVVPSANLVESFLGDTLTPFVEEVNKKQNELQPTGSAHLPVYVSAKGVVSEVQGTTVPVGAASYNSSSSNGYATIWIE